MYIQIVAVCIHFYIHNYPALLSTDLQECRDMLYSFLKNALDINSWEEKKIIHDLDIQFVLRFV